MATNTAPSLPESVESELDKMRQVLRKLIYQKDAALNSTEYEEALSAIWELQAKMRPLQQQAHHELNWAMSKK